jgi:hypothetical protein
MSTRVIIPNDVQSLIDELRPYLAPEMKEIDVIRTVLVDFKLNRTIPRDVNGFGVKTRQKLLQSKTDLDSGEVKVFDNFEEVLRYAKNHTKQPSN